MGNRWIKTKGSHWILRDNNDKEIYLRKNLRQLVVANSSSLYGLPKKTTVQIEENINPGWGGKRQFLAKKQTKAARNLFYDPDSLFKKELGLAAEQLYNFVIKSDDYYAKLLGARLFGSEGVLVNKTPDDLIKILGKVKDEKEGMRGNAKANDRIVVVSLMGDIGALYADTGATTGIEGRSPSEAEKLRNKFLEFMKSSKKDIEQAVKNSQLKAGSSVVGPKKKKERSRLPLENAKPRTGIHNIGEEVDRELNIHQDKRIFKATWQTALIYGKRVINTQEPLVGHMSGSPTEILQVWDWLRGVESGSQYISFEEQRYNVKFTFPHELAARAAGASAFLIAMGYHSAVEVLESTMLYLGQTIRQKDWKDADAANYFGYNAATELISELHRSFTDGSVIK